MTYAVWALMAPWVVSNPELPSIPVPFATKPPPLVMQVRGPQDRFVPFRYPADASNYVWSVQRSTNLSAWTTVATNLYWPPSTNGDVVARTMDYPRVYYRAVGTRATNHP